MDRKTEIETLRRRAAAVNARLPDGLIFGYGRLDDLEADEAAGLPEPPGPSRPDDMSDMPAVPVIKWLEVGNLDAPDAGSWNGSGVVRRP